MAQAQTQYRDWDDWRVRAIPHAFAEGAFALLHCGHHFGVHPTDMRMDGPLVSISAHGQVCARLPLELLPCGEQLDFEAYDAVADLPPEYRLSRCDENDEDEHEVVLDTDYFNIDEQPFKAIWDRWFYDDCLSGLSVDENEAMELWRRRKYEVTDLEFHLRHDGVYLTVDVYLEAD